MVLDLFLRYSVLYFDPMRSFRRRDQKGLLRLGELVGVPLWLESRVSLDCLIPGLRSWIINLPRNLSNRPSCLRNSLECPVGVGHSMPLVVKHLQLVHPVDLIYYGAIELFTRLFVALAR